MSSGDRGSVVPSCVLVVEDAVSEAAVEDPDEAIGESSQGTMVSIARGAPLVVEGPSARARSEGGECPLVGGVGEPCVAGVAGEHDTLFAGCPRDGRRAGVVLATLGVAIAVRVIPELAE